ncbi:MAG TPA: protein translocase SEC61 complex subunit gamma [Candidatus Acidoferrum sp.]|nr:protein translocase SEC61 complex subunit gamma [Candidatus Acidoferrum sp.]
MNIMLSIRSFITNARHIMYVSYKPSNERFKRTAKLIILGILTVGGMGFIIAIIVSLLVYGSLSFV